MRGEFPVLLRRLCLVAVMAGIFWLSHQPSLRLVPPLFPLQDKVLHGVEFMVLGLALFLNRDIFGRRFRWSGMALAGVIWAASDEVHQHYVVGRDCSTGDFLADCAGLLIVLLILRHRSDKPVGSGRDRETGDPV
jgi:hypothetical protein